MPAVVEIEDGPPEEIALANALAKARAVADGRSRVIGCDTIVALDGRVFGKPADGSQARATLTALSGRTHEVISGLALIEGTSEHAELARTRVSFRTIAPELMDWFIAREEWRERSGAYAIQGGAAAFARSIEGDFENIVGLPVALLIAHWPDLLSGSPGPPADAR